MFCRPISRRNIYNIYEMQRFSDNSHKKIKNLQKKKELSKFN